MTMEPGSFAEWVGAVVAVGALYVAWTELGAARKTASADFIHRLKDDFFTEEATRIVQSVSEKRLTFIVDTVSPYFLLDGKDRLSMFDMDRHVMLPLENLGALAIGKLIDIKLAYEFFAWHVCLVWKDEAIQKYVAWTRDDPKDNDYFYSLEDLAGKFSAYEISKRRQRVRHENR
jgi:hypothetical protein